MNINFKKLLAGADQGHYTAPQWLIDARRREETIARLLSETPSRIDIDRAERGLLAEFLEAASEGSDVPDVGPRLLDLHHQQEAAEHRHSFLLRARESATMPGFDAEEIIVEHLWPALAETIEKAKRCVSALKAYQLELLNPDLRERALADAPKSVSDGWFKLGELAERYGAVRQARSFLWLAGVRASEDDADYFAEIKNLDSLWPAFRPNAQNASPVPPWPTESRARLAWLITNAADLWMPTPAEQDAKYRRWLPEERKRIAAQFAGAAVTSR